MNNTRTFQYGYFDNRTEQMVYNTLKIPSATSLFKTIMHIKYLFYSGIMYEQTKFLIIFEVLGTVDKPIYVDAIRVNRFGTIVFKNKDYLELFRSTKHDKNNRQDSVRASR